MDAARICDPPLLVCNLRLVEDYAGVCQEPSAIRPAAWGAMETWIFVPWFPSLLLFSAAVSCVFLVRWSNAFPKWLVAVMSLLPIVTSIVITTSAFFGLKQV